MQLIQNKESNHGTHRSSSTLPLAQIKFRRTPSIHQNIPNLILAKAKQLFANMAQTEERPFLCQQCVIICRVSVINPCSPLGPESLTRSD